MVTTNSEVARPVNAMTVDVEDYFQVSAFEPYLSPDQWHHQESRVEYNMHRILDLFGERGVQATFFTLGWIAERYPQLVRRLVDEGHELASHGWSHVRVTQQNPAEFRADVSRTKALLEDLSGVAVQGYRAASYSIGRDNLWALEELREAGYRYSSSIFPIRHDLYGMHEAPRFGYRPHDDHFMEFPLTTVRLGGRNLPCAGGGWFRLLPYGVTRWALRQVNRQEGRSAIFYFHPWEIDPGQPRREGLDRRTRFRHYLNLARTEDRLVRLLDDFDWGRMDQVLYHPSQEGGA